MENTETDMPKRPGRPPLGAESLMKPRTIRFTKAMLEEIEAIQEQRALDGPEFGQVVRELVAKGLEVSRKRK
jgi:hypothetical protein